MTKALMPVCTLTSSCTTRCVTAGASAIHIVACAGLADVSDLAEAHEAAARAARAAESAMGPSGRSATGIGAHSQGIVCNQVLETPLPILTCCLLTLRPVQVQRPPVLGTAAETRSRRPSLGGW